MQVYRLRVMPRALLALLLAACVSCQERKSEVDVTETRSITIKDASPKLDATSDERFLNARPGPLQGTTPDGWLAKPSTEFRLLNYRFGASGLGEVFVGISRGSILDNANRWLNEFQTPPIDAAALDSLKRIPLLNTSGVLVTASGTYSPGRGAPPIDGFSLAGLIADIDGQILTIKMVGPEADVREAIPALESFANSLKWRSGNPVSGD